MTMTPIKSLHDFPVELITKVLSWLPTRQLVQVRCVSKALDMCIRASSDLWRNMVVPFRSNWAFADQALAVVAKYGHYMATLELHNARDDVVNALLPYCQNLTSLKIHGWRTLSDHAFAHVINATNDGNAPYFARLRHFELVDNGGFYSAIGSRTVGAISRAAPQLESIHVWCNAQLDPSVTLELVERCPKLRRISLSSFQQHDDEDVTGIALGAPNLVYLNISHARNVSDEALAAIGSNCPKLQVLAIHGADRISDNGMLAVATGCRKLHTLKLFDCRNVSLGIMDSMGFESVLYTPQIAHKPCFKVGIGFGFERKAVPVPYIDLEQDELAEELAESVTPIAPLSPTSAVFVQA